MKFIMHFICFMISLCLHVLIYPMIDPCSDCNIDIIDFSWWKWTTQHLIDSVPHNICFFDLWPLDLEKFSALVIFLGNYPYRQYLKQNVCSFIILYSLKHWRLLKYCIIYANAKSIHSFEFERFWNYWEYYLKAISLI